MSCLTWLVEHLGLRQKSSGWANGTANEESLGTALPNLKDHLDQTMMCYHNGITQRPGCGHLEGSPIVMTSACQESIGRSKMRKSCNFQIECVWKRSAAVYFAARSSGGGRRMWSMVVMVGLVATGTPGWNWRTQGKKYMASPSIRLARRTAYFRQGVFES